MYFTVHVICYDCNVMITVCRRLNDNACKCEINIDLIHVTILFPIPVDIEYFKSPVKCVTMLLSYIADKFYQTGSQKKCTLLMCTFNLIFF